MDRAEMSHHLVEGLGLEVGMKKPVPHDIDAQTDELDDHGGPYPEPRCLGLHRLRFFPRRSIRPAPIHQARDGGWSRPCNWAGGLVAYTARISWMLRSLRLARQLHCLQVP